MTNCSGPEVCGLNCVQVFISSTCSHNNPSRRVNAKEFNLLFCSITRLTLSLSIPVIGAI